MSKKAVVLTVPEGIPYLRVIVGVDGRLYYEHETYEAVDDYTVRRLDREDVVELPPDLKIVDLGSLEHGEQALLSALCYPEGHPNPLRGLEWIKKNAPVPEDQLGTFLLGVAYGIRYSKNDIPGAE